jgi:hypothetical protein
MYRDDYMPTCNSNFELFDQHAKINHEGIKAVGETVPSFIVMLLQGTRQLQMTVSESIFRAREIHMIKVRIWITAHSRQGHLSNIKPCLKTMNGVLSHHKRKQLLQSQNNSRIQI